MVRYFPLAPLFSLSLLAHALLVSSPPSNSSLPFSPTHFNFFHHHFRRGFLSPAGYHCRDVIINTPTSPANHHYPTRSSLCSSRLTSPFIVQSRICQTVATTPDKDNRSFFHLFFSRPRFPTNPTRHRNPIDHLTEFSCPRRLAGPLSPFPLD